MGERKTLRLVAQYADACNLFDIPDEGATIRRKLAALARHCEDLGRDYDSIEKTLSSRLAASESAEQFAARCSTLAALGIDHVVLITDRTVDPQGGRRAVCCSFHGRRVHGLSGDESRQAEDDPLPTCLGLLRRPGATTRVFHKRDSVADLRRSTYLTTNSWRP